MRTHMHMAAWSALTALAGSAAVANPILYSQTPVDQLASANSQFVSGSLLRRTADDFTLATGNTNPYTVTRVTAFMHSAFGASDTTRYGLDIYADGVNGPGALVTRILGASRVEDRGWAPSNMRIVETYFDMSLPLAAGQRYWVSAFGINGTTGQTRFSSHDYGGAAIGMTARYLMADGSWAPIETAADPMMRDFAFTVSGIQAVPAPGAFGMLAGAGVVAMRRRRR